MIQPKLPNNAPMIFARNFLKYPRMLGSFIPSSRFLIHQVLKQIDWHRARLIVEYGPGVGTITAEILRRMRPDATLIAIETNGEFVHMLKHFLPDTRLHLVHGSAADVNLLMEQRGYSAADYVISGIPFSTMPSQIRDAILHTTNAVLHPRGAFLVYQFTGSLLPHLERIFARVERGFELRNILPARLFYCAPRVNGHDSSANCKQHSL